jgi:hypothetical protein
MDSFLKNMIVPWVPYKTLPRFYNATSNGKKVFEWGCGASTIFFNAHGCKTISVEHSKVYADIIRGITGSTVMCVEPECKISGKVSPNLCLYNSGNGYIYKEYCNAINKFDKFDIIMIDGRARPTCIMNSVKHISDNGVVILDNSNRAKYKEACNAFFKGWWNETMTGNGPASSIAWSLTAFSKTANNIWIN